MDLSPRLKRAIDELLKPLPLPARLIFEPQIRELVSAILEAQTQEKEE